MGGRKGNWDRREEEGKGGKEEDPEDKKGKQETRPGRQNQIRK